MANLAEKYLLQAAERGHANAKYNLGLLYKKQGKHNLSIKYLQ